METPNTEELASQIDWQFLESLKALEKCIDPKILADDVFGQIKIDERIINQELEQQPSKAFRWSALAIRVSKIVNLFEHAVVRPYLGHVRSYSKLWLAGAGEKETTRDDREEAAMKLFVNGLTDEQQTKNAERCLIGRLFGGYRGFGDEKTKAMVAKHIEDNKEQWAAQVAQMRAEMYYPKIPAYQEVMARREEYEEKRQLSSSLAEAMKQRGICVTSIASNMRAGIGGDGIRMMANTVNARMVGLVRKTLQNNPGLTDELLVEIMQAHSEEGK